MTGPITLVGIVAMARNRVIGHEGDIPWHEPADMAHFKQTTMDHPVIVGRVTYEGITESLGGPLPGRTMIVLTSQSLDTPEEVVTVDGVAPAITAARRAARERHGIARAFVAGGASVYEAFLPFLDRLVVTEVDAEPPGDTHFPAYDTAAWTLVGSDEIDEGLVVREYTRR